MSLEPTSKLYLCLNPGISVLLSLMLVYLAFLLLRSNRQGMFKFG